MSFIDSMRRLFGIDTDSADTDELTDTDSGASGVQSEVKTEVEGLTELPLRPVADPAMKARLFEGVVAVFNEALPDFLRRSVDPARQSKLIADSLDESLRQYLDDLAAEASQRAEANLKNVLDGAKRESERLRNEMEHLEQQRATLREQQLSAERRRRALADRVSDLEAQLASAEAEREQFDLEKKSLLNKIKLAEVQPGVIEELQQEIERLKAGDTAASADSEPTAALQAEIEELKDALAAARAEAENNLKEIDAVRQQLTEAVQEVAASREEAADRRQAAEANLAMYNDLQSRLVAEREARVKADAEVEEARKVYETVVEMQRQMQMVETVIQKRDERIARLKANNKKLKEELARVKEQLEESGISHRDGGLFDIVQEDIEVQEEHLAEPTPEEEAALAAIEDDFECPDWFVSRPAEGEGGLRASEEPFGYTPPVRKPAPENDAQLSLF